MSGDPRIEKTRGLPHIDIVVLSEPDEFNRRAVMDDHRRANAIRRGTGGMNDFLTFESGVEIVHLKGDMWNIANEFMKGTVVLEPHPLDTVRAGGEAGDVETKRFQIRLGVVHDAGGDSNVVETPSELCDHGRWFVVEPPSEAKTLKVLGEIVSHEVLDLCST